MDTRLAENKKNPKYEKSNVMVTSAYNMSTLEQKTIVYVLSEIRGKRFSEKEMKMGIRVCFNAKTLLDILMPDTKRKSVYGDLKELSEKIQSRKITIDNKNGDNNEFVQFPLIKTCEYIKGVFSITFHELASPLITNLDSNFTVFDLTTVMTMKSNYSIRLYELLKSHVWKMKDGMLDVEYDLMELRITLGVVDTSTLEVKSLLNKYKDDTDMLEKKLEELDSTMSLADKRKKKQVYKYKMWDEFKRYVLEPARKEIEASVATGYNDFYFTYDAVKKGRKVKTVLFHLIKKDVIPEIEQTETENVTYLDAIDMVEEYGIIEFLHLAPKYYFEVPAPDKINSDIQQSYKLLIISSIGECLNISVKMMAALQIAEVCGYDLNRFFANLGYTYNAVKKSGKIKDVQAYLISACRDNYAANKSTGLKNQFNDFENTRNYDYEEMEKELLSYGFDHMN